VDFSSKKFFSISTRQVLPLQKGGYYKPLGSRIYATIVGQGFSLAIKNNANLK